MNTDDARKAPGRKHEARALPPERLVCCIWYDEERLLRGKLCSLDGKTVTIVSPGFWNTGRGPDFLGGVFRTGKGPRTCGDVEVHRNRRDWKSHAHRKDPAFGNVRLHVFLHNDGALEKPVNHEGKGLTEICLEDHLRGRLARLLARTDPSRYPYLAPSPRGMCGEMFRRLGNPQTRLFLRSFGEERLRRKSRLLSSPIRSYGNVQALYRSLLESLGFSRHKEAFTCLSRRLSWKPLSEMLRGLEKKKRPLFCEAAILGAAGLVPERPLPGWDAESLRHLRRIIRARDALRRHLPSAPMERSRWRGWGSRPANAPWRRIAGVSPLLARAAGTGLTAALFPDSGAWTLRRMRRSLDGLLDGPGRNYWERRYDWGGGRLPRPVSLIGKGRRDEIITNVLLPFLYRRGKREEALSIFRELPAARENSVTGLMKTRLFGNGAAAMKSGGAAAQQGLIHIYKKYCLPDRTGCRQCPFPSIIGKKVSKKSVEEKELL